MQDREPVPASKNLPDFRNLRTVAQVAKESGGVFTEASLRWLIFNSETNGFDRAIVRVGRRVHIDIVGFNAWLGR